MEKNKKIEKDKRRDKRLPVPDRSVLIRKEGAGISLSSLENISEGGLCILSADPLALDEEVECRFSIPVRRDPIINTSAKVVWEKIADGDRPRIWYGLKFNYIVSEERDFIRQFARASRG